MAIGAVILGPCGGRAFVDAERGVYEPIMETELLDVNDIEYKSMSPKRTVFFNVRLAMRSRKENAALAKRAALRKQKKKKR